MKKKFLGVILFFLIFLCSTNNVVLACTPNEFSCSTSTTVLYCKADGTGWAELECPDGMFCDTSLKWPAVCSSPSDALFGAIEAPPGVAEFNQQSESGIGIIVFFSNLIKLIAIIAGIWTMLNFILAGFTYVTSADNPSAIEKIGSKLTLSVVGLGIIVASYTIAAVIGLIIFGDATFIINPQIPSAIM